jgi:hypothetical protein
MPSKNINTLNLNYPIRLVEGMRQAAGGITGAPKAGGGWGPAVAEDATYSGPASNNRDPEIFDDTVCFLRRESSLPRCN